MSTDSSQRDSFEKWISEFSTAPELFDLEWKGFQRGWQASNAQSQELIAELMRLIDSKLEYYQQARLSDSWDCYRIVCSELKNIKSLVEKAKSHLKQQEQPNGGSNENS